LTKLTQNNNAVVRHLISLCSHTDFQCIWSRLRQVYWF